jgi:nickel-dependent lactate racemase
VAGLFAGTPEAAFASAAALSRERHVIWKPRRFSQVLAVMPPMYDELWVGSKGMYKTEPVLENDGEVILYAPQITRLSRVHGALIRQLGYHVRDYLIAHRDDLRGFPLRILAHSAYVKGVGTYVGGVERPRVRVTLATSIPEDECRAVNLGYRDPLSIDPRRFAHREDEGILLVERAGESLYRSTAPDPWPAHPISWKA